MAATKHRRWKMKISFLRSDSPHRRLQQPPPPLPEFLCPVAGVLMADPVIVPSGQSFERCSVQACRELGHLPRLPDGARPDISSLIPNLGLKSAISNWCEANGVDRPSPLSLDAAKDAVRKLVESSGVAKHKSQSPTRPGDSRSGGGGGTAKDEKLVPLTGESSESSEKELLKGMADHPQVKSFYAATEVKRRPESLYLSATSSGDSPAPRTPLPLATKPSCFSSSSSSSDSLSPLPTTASANDNDEDEIYTKLKSQQEAEQEEGLIVLRRKTKMSPEMRIVLCTTRMLSALRPLLVSRYTAIQVNAVAALVNLSLEKQNKVQIVRAGAVPALVDALKGGFPEAQEHAAGAVFSLALDDENKTAIGVLGALPPLLHLVARSESGRAREDAALALYHLSLAQANRSKLVKLGAIPALLALATGGGYGTIGLANRVLIILCNVAAGAEGRAALLDAHAVERMVRTLREAGPGAPEREGCVAVLYALSQSGMRFRGSAKSAGAVEVLKEVALAGGERAREKAVRMLRMLREGRSEEGFAGLREEEEDDEEDWRGEETSGSMVAFRRRLAGGKLAGANSTEF